MKSSLTKAYPPHTNQAFSINLITNMQEEKFSLTNGRESNGVQYPETFTMNEFIEREQAAKPKGKKWLFNLLIVLVLLRELIMLPYYIVIGVYKWVRKLTTKV